MQACTAHSVAGGEDPVMTISSTCSYHDLVVAIRVKQWIKNLIIPGVGLAMLELPLRGLTPLINLALAFVAFCIAASSIYLLNDIMDMAKDRAHPTKRHRPIASGRIKAPLLWLLLGLAWPIAVGIASLANLQVFALVLSYLIINIGYCIKFKNIPQVDIVCVASGFTIRALIGAFCVGNGVNFWLLAAVVFACMGLAVMKRMKELKSMGATGETRPVLSRYDYDTLVRTHDMFMVLSVLSATLFLEHRSDGNPLASAAMLTFISAVLLAFIDRVQANADGDPTNLIYKHKYLSASVVLLAVTFVLVN